MSVSNCLTLCLNLFQVKNMLFLKATPSSSILKAWQSHIHSTSQHKLLLAQKEPLSPPDRQTDCREPSLCNPPAHSQPINSNTAVRTGKGHSARQSGAVLTDSRAFHHLEPGPSTSRTGLLPHFSFCCCWFGFFCFHVFDSCHHCGGEPNSNAIFKPSPFEISDLRTGFYKQQVETHQWDMKAIDWVAPNRNL